MKGISLCEKYYETYVNRLIALLPEEYKGKICFGVAGRGSEFFGFDDEVSLDHDFMPGFYAFLTEEQDNKIGFALMREYSKLPKEFEGVSLREHNLNSPNHFGVIKIGDFFYKMVGKSEMFSCWQDWFYTPSHALSCAVNGKVFCEGDGSFSIHRQNLLSMPEDVKLKKISARLALMAQSGQYNFARCLKHGERGGAVLAKNEFCIHTANLCHLLQNRYAPFYKWLIRSVGGDFLDNIRGDIVDLLNLNDSKKEQDLIDKISFKIHNFLIENDFITNNEDYLENSAFEIKTNIKNREIKALHIMDFGE